MRGLLVAVLGTATLLLGACGWEIARNSLRDDDSVDANITSVRVDNESGDVAIRAGEKASVHREVHYRHDRPGRTHHVEGSTLVIDSCPVRNCSIYYVVTVPRGTRVNGRSDSGAVDVDGAAEVNLKVDSGDLTVRGVSGTVSVEVDSGAVRLSDIGGDVAVRASSGDITVDNARAAVTVKDDSGAIRVTVPRGAYRVNASTDSGAVRSQVTDDPSGTHRLELHTSSGDIVLGYL